MSCKEACRDVARISVIVAAMIVSPLVFHHGSARVSDCSAETAQGMCCVETGSICNAGGDDMFNFYYDPGCCSYICF